MDTGKNQLGNLLMSVRNSCLNESEIDDWINGAVKLLDSEDVSQIPHIRLDVLKDGLLIETINLNNRNAFKFGRGGFNNSTDTV